MNSNNKFVAIVRGEVFGDPALISERFPVASLFKIVLSHTALKLDKITLDEQLTCNDTLEKAGKPQITLLEAMLYSSNDFFKQLLERLTPAELIAGMKSLNFPANCPDEKEVTECWADFWRGGNIQVSPEEVFSLASQLADLANGSKLLQAIKRPHHNKMLAVYGKTGTWGGAAWCVGFSVNSESGEVKQVATVLIPYIVPNWYDAHIRAIELFNELVN